MKKYILILLLISSFILRAENFKTVYCLSVDHPYADGPHCTITESIQTIVNDTVTEYKTINVVKIKKLSEVKRFFIIKNIKEVFITRAHVKDKPLLNDLEYNKRVRKVKRYLGKDILVKVHSSYK